MLLKDPQTEWDSPLAAFEHVLSHEQTVTGLINNLVDIAITEKDHATNNFLQWFVEEQVEEEENAMELVGKVKRAQNSVDLMYTLDSELASRVYTPPGRIRKIKKVKNLTFFISYRLLWRYYNYFIFN